ncbi:MAG TPA: Gfo/Idh/MocA family oxidoreductase [Gammaproteobacteria bacterium]|nr:Gfo/Idh/MocA family oxidoreductase [Gammaproteobacteria bacterium]
MPATHKSSKSLSAAGSKQRVRFAVVGLGYIAQAAVLPAFAHARNAQLVALVSDDPVKLKKLSKQYGATHSYSYEQYEACLKSGEIDAVYIALPNNLHREYTTRAARAGIHVLCEKPMAITENDCAVMMAAVQKHGVKFMVAYRLHFEKANMLAAEIARSGKLGEVRLFNSVFTMQVKPGDIRLQQRLGGGTLYDIGIYCINAARYLFAAEPLEVVAFTANNGEQRFAEVEEITGALLRFPDDRLATFTCSFNGANVSSYHIIGSKGDLRVSPAYEYADELKHQLTIKGKTRERSFPQRDQFGAELLYFSECILADQEPEPSGKEGLADVRVIRALYRSAQTGRPVRLAEFDKRRRPGLRQEIRLPAVQKPQLLHAQAPSGG